MDLIWINTVDSTNSYLKLNQDTIPEMTMVAAHTQTAGRGQRGNSWESEPGKNLTLSFYFRPVGVPPLRQFAVSEAVSLALVDLLLSYGIEAKVKWPNDIYVADKKICGILIEHSLCGAEIVSSICGIGLNVNQVRFISPAPNPVSMISILSKATPLSEVADRLGRALAARINGLLSNPTLSIETLHTEYFNQLYRADGNYHRFLLTNRSPLLPSLDSNLLPDHTDATPFLARIHSIDPSGPIILQHPDGSLSTHSFKEIAFL